MTPPTMTEQVISRAKRSPDFGWKFGVIRPNKNLPGIDVARWKPDFRDKVKQRFTQLMQDPSFIEPAISLLGKEVRGLFSTKVLFLWAAFKAGEKALSEIGGWAIPPVTVTTKKEAALRKISAAPRPGEPGGD